MPMRPRPMAETSSPCVPSERVVSMTGAKESALTAGGILRVADMFHPVDCLALERLLNGNVLHRIRWRRPMPVLFSRFEPYHITRPDLLDGPTIPLNEPAAE